MVVVPGRRVVVALLALAALIVPAPTAHAVTPATGATYPAGTAAEAPCFFTNGGVDTRRQFWLAVTIDPERAHGTAATAA